MRDGKLSGAVLAVCVAMAFLGCLGMMVVGLSAADPNVKDVGVPGGPAAAVVVADGSSGNDGANGVGTGKASASAEAAARPGGATSGEGGGDKVKDEVAAPVELGRTNAIGAAAVVTGITAEELKKFIHLSRLLAQGQMDERGDYDRQQVQRSRSRLLADALAFQLKFDDNMAEYLRLLDLLDKSVAGMVSKAPKGAVRGQGRN